MGSEESFPSAHCSQESSSVFSLTYSFILSCMRVFFIILFIYIFIWKLSHFIYLVLHVHASQLAGSSRGWTLMMVALWRRLVANARTAA